MRSTWHGNLGTSVVSLEKVSCVLQQSQDRNGTQSLGNPLSVCTEGNLTGTEERGERFKRVSNSEGNRGALYGLLCHWSCKMEAYFSPDSYSKFNPLSWAAYDVVWHRSGLWLSQRLVVSCQRLDWTKWFWFILMPKRNQDSLPLTTTSELCSVALHPHLFHVVV